MKQNIAVTALTALCLLIIYAAASIFFKPSEDERNKILKVGFVYESDESTPYSYNFIRAQREAEHVFNGRIETLVRNNVPEYDCDDAIKSLVDAGCGLIITNSYGFGESTKKIASENPDVQFCSATCDNANTEPVLSNYHTFMGEIYEGRYISGAVAGLKLQELINTKVIKPSQAKIGYVGAYPYPEVISGYTAFMLGARKYCPTATMEVVYTNTWCNYALEKKYAEALINDDCVIISQHSDTIGPAVACEEASLSKTVFHVGYNHSMIDIAPTTSLIAARINWIPYIIGAIKAVLENRTIEKVVKGHTHGNDIGAGIENNWVQILECNISCIAPGTEAEIKRIQNNFIKGRQKVFYGDYIGINPSDPEDIYDLSTEYIENKNASAPSFHYILKDVISILDL
ncbi:MAG: BMP family ABC transporter substrate-binding protein [Treponema sp.]|nr:BMP family ABC transporter substrate-binding protein [Treponema sp.]